jgi:iron complex transport system substrate-binding protein
MKKAIVIGFLTGASLVFSQYPVTVENCGNTLTFDKAPERVVAVSTTTAKLLITLGLESTIVGVGGTKEEPLLPEFETSIQSLPSLSEFGGINREVMLSVQPDFVFDSNPLYAYDANEGFATQDELREAGAVSYSLTAKCQGSNEAATIEDLFDDTENLGVIFNVEEKAVFILAEMKQALAQVSEKIAGQPPVKTMIYDSGEGPLTVFGPGTWDYVLELAGGVNVFEDVTSSYAEVSLEEVITRDIEVILVPDYDGAAQTRADFLKTTFPEVAAVQNNRVLVIPYSFINPGIENIQGVQALAQYFYPDVFTE